MGTKLPDLSRFELECLRRLWELGEASVGDVRDSFPDPPGYSTIRKIFERLEEKGAVRRTGVRGRAQVYRSAVRPAAMIRKEIGRLLDSLFDGAGSPLVSHLADMDRLSIDDLREIENQLGGTSKPKRKGGRL